MTYKGVYRDGVIVLRGDVELREGARVNITPERKGDARVRSRSKNEATREKAPSHSRAPRSKRPSVHPVIALAGIWKDRPEWAGKSSVEVAAELRSKSWPISNRGRTRRG